MIILSLILACVFFWAGHNVTTNNDLSVDTCCICSMIFCAAAMVLMGGEES